MPRRDKNNLYQTLAVALLLTFCFAMKAVAADSFATGGLNQLETKFFEHTYPSDTNADRLDRLEKMVFGETRQGTDADRLNTLMQAVPSKSADSQAPQDDSSNQRASQPLQSETPEQAPADTSDDGDSPPPGGDKYPRVGELERLILGNVYANEPIRQRLDQLELKAFGKASATTDLCDRVDRLDDYAEKRAEGAGRRRVSSGGPAFDLSQEPGAGQPIEDKVSWLEMQILGHTNPHTPMIERLRPLEKAVFPTDPTDIHASIPEQVNMLIAAVELLSKQQQGNAPENQDLSIQPLMNSQAPPPGQAYYGQPQYNNAPYQGGSPPPSYVNSYARPYAQQQQQPVAYGSSYQANPQGYAYGSTAPASGAPVYQQGQPVATTHSTNQQSHGHPFLRSLAHVLGTVGSMAAGSMSGGMMPYGGYGTPAVFGWP